MNTSIYESILSVYICTCRSHKEPWDMLYFHCTCCGTLNTSSSVENCGQSTYIVHDSVCVGVCLYILAHQ